MAGSREMQVHQTVEVSWEPRPFQPELEGLPWFSGTRFSSWLGTKIPHAVRHSQQTHTKQNPETGMPCMEGSRETQGQEQGSKSGSLGQKQRGSFHARSFRRQDRRTVLQSQRLSPLSCLPHCVPRTPDPIIKSTSWLPYPDL